MAPSFWTSAEEKALVDFLHENKSEAGDGGNFKKTTFQRASQHITPLCSNGHSKDVKSCQNKWANLRKVFKVIRAIQSVSGWHWDNDTGASITPETASSWDDYVKKHPEAKPFQNRGWIHFHKVADIMPSTPSGANVYHPAGSQVPLASTAHPTSRGISSSPEPDTLSDSTEEVNLTTLGPQKRAREPSTPTRAKRPRRYAGAEALLGMSTSINAFGDKMAAALAPPAAMEPTPRRRTKAIINAQKLEKSWLSIQELVSFIDILRRDQSAFDVYLALDEADIQKEWVRIQLDNAGQLEHIC